MRRGPRKPRVLPQLPSIDEVQREHALRVLAACNGDRKRAAQILGIAASTLARKLSRWIVRPERRQHPMSTPE